MSKNLLEGTCRSFDMPKEAPHKQLRRKAGAMFVSGCLALTMFPALALAQPGGDDPFAQNNQNQPEMNQGFGGENGMPQQGFGGFGGFGDMGGFGGGEGFGNSGGFDGGQQQMQQPGGQQPGWGGDANGMSQQPDQGDGQGQQPGDQPADGNQGQQPNSGQPGQGGQNQQPGQMGQQPGQGQLGENGQMGQMPPMMPEQARDLLERVYDLLGIDEEANPIDNIMSKLGFAMQDIAGNMMGQPSQQLGQLGQQPGQPGQMGQPGDMGGQPGQNQNQGQDQSQGAMPGQPGSMTGQPGGANNQQPGQPGGMSGAPTSYDAANTPDADASGATYSSTADNENAVLVDGKQITLSDFTVSKTGSASGEDVDFYGTNAGILANNQANLTITGATVTTDGAHANGVFSYGTGTSISISDSTITTTGNNSGGLMTTGGASLTAKNLTVNTSGNSSAAIRSDRGGGTVTATQGSYSTTGVGSPAIYSTADITVSDATLSATNSEAVVIEGGNSVTLNNANVTGSNAKLNGQSTIATNVLIYQSMSGDASEGSSSFTMTDGSLTSLTGAMFHVTNVTTTINLTNVKLTNAADSNDLLVATADSWGTSGKNGGHATVNLSSQTASGNITVDSVSSVDLNLTGNSSYTGAISNDGTVNVKVESGSTWTLTADSYVTSLDNAGTINLNGHTLYVNGKAYTA